MFSLATNSKRQRKREWVERICKDGQLHVKTVTCYCDLLLFFFYDNITISSRSGKGKTGHKEVENQFELKWEGIME